MRNIDTLPLLVAMDLAADMIRATNCDYCPADDAIIFRKLQKQRLPTLNPEQVQTLYAEWQDRYAAKCAQDRNKAAEHLTRYIEEQARQNPPSPPFKCVCGAETKDPMDPEFMRIHQPHCQAAGEERIAHEQRERRARQRSGSRADLTTQHRL